MAERWPLEMADGRPRFLGDPDENAAHPSTRHQTLPPILIEAKGALYLTPFTRQLWDGRENGQIWTIISRD